MTLTLLPDVEAGPAERVVRMTVAVGVNRLGGWAIIGWRGAAPAELREQCQQVVDDPAGAVRLITLEVPVIADAALAQLLEDDTCQP